MVARRFARQQILRTARARAIIAAPGWFATSLLPATQRSEPTAADFARSLSYIFTRFFDDIFNSHRGFNALLKSDYRAVVVVVVLPLYHRLYCDFYCIIIFYNWLTVDG